MPFGLRTWVGPGNDVVDGVQIPSWEGAILGERRAHCKYRDFLLWAVQERPNWSICRLDCGLGWAKGSTSLIIFARWRQYAQMWRHIGTTWRIQFNHPSAAARRSYVKLLRPLVSPSHSNPFIKHIDTVAVPSDLYHLFLVSLKSIHMTCLLL